MPLSVERILAALRSLQCRSRGKYRQPTNSQSLGFEGDIRVKLITSCVLSAIALSAFASVYAAEAEKGMISRVYNDVVVPTEQVAYEAGVKAYNKCLAEHGFKYSWTAWGHETGNTYLYSYVAGPYTWADFDKAGEVGKACDPAWRTNSNPHLKSEVSAFLELRPELSYAPKEANAKPNLMNVVWFTLKPGREAGDAFADGMKKIAAAAEKANWPNHFIVQRVRGGDKDFPDYILASQHKNWAEYGAASNPMLWKMVEGVYGQADADAIRKSINGAIDDVHSHVNKYNEELTYTAPSK
jgi:hypothetical protein